jgi:signal transduction histidine kinase
VVMDELVGETARRYATQLQEQGIELRLDLEGGNTRIRVNPGEIQQVVQNLVVNASQALGAGGQINVATRVHEGRVEISVLDTGPGIPEDLLEKIFTPFFTTKASGSGLGLTICAQIAKAHGGELSVRRCLPRGAAFTLVVPLPKPVAHPV